MLLQSLCVVDVDAPELAVELEAKFGEVLKDVPLERTRKGWHYWFERSAKCERDGYFDARAPATKGIDFKTRCYNGTSGIIVVAPSADKTWERAPWAEGVVLRPIPDELLAHVARPRRLARTVDARFSDVRLRVRVFDDTLRLMSYV